MEFHTLQEFMLHTKGWAYVLMGACLVGYIGFWKFLTGRDKKFLDGKFNDHH